jgi:hypothetical protein
MMMDPLQISKSFALEQFSLDVNAMEMMNIKIGCMSIGLPQKKKRLNYTAAQLKTCH